MSWKISKISSNCLSRCTYLKQDVNDYKDEYQALELDPDVYQHTEAKVIINVYLGKIL